MFQLVQYFGKNWYIQRDKYQYIVVKRVECLNHVQKMKQKNESKVMKDSIV